MLRGEQLLELRRVADIYLGQERALGLIVVYLIKLCKTFKAHGIAGGGEQAVFALGGVLLVGARYFELRRILHAGSP